ncbi:MAG TPA: hypothetical protein VM433_01615, partial [Mycobacteriales bacterium]|nr:hypothetical protein [Mycobacteriales bacterium]
MPADRVDVLIRMDRARSREQVVQELTAAGLQVERVMSRVGVVSGSVAPEALDGLGQVPGVSSVER